MLFRSPSLQNVVGPFGVITGDILHDPIFTFMVALPEHPEELITVTV